MERGRNPFDSDVRLVELLPNYARIRPDQLPIWFESISPKLRVLAEMAHSKVLPWFAGQRLDIYLDDEYKASEQIVSWYSHAAFFKNSSSSFAKGPGYAST